MSPEAPVDAEAQVRRTLTEYCRAVDRCDEQLLREVFTADATVDYGIFKGTAADFATFILPMLRDYYTATSHCLQNCLIDLVDDGRTAHAETYAVVHDVRSGPDGTRWFEQLGCRYVDRLEPSAGRWRITERVVVLDWNVAFPAPVEYSAATAQAPFVLGTRDRDDFSYRRLS